MRIGPTFLTELRAAGADQVKCTWTTEDVWFNDGVSEADKAKVLAVLAVHDPNAITREMAIAAAIRGDTILATLKAMTSDQFDTWWANNVTTAAQAIQVLRRFAKLVILRLL